MDKGARYGEATAEPVGQQEHVRLGKKVGQVEAALGQFHIRGVAGVPELLIRPQLVELVQRDDRVHVLGRLVPGFVGGKSQRECSAPVKGQLDRVVEVTVEGLQDEERVIHDG